MFSCLGLIGYWKLMCNRFCIVKYLDKLGVDMPMYLK